MEYYINYDDIRSVHKYINGYIADWLDDIGRVCDGLADMITNPAMSGKAAYNIYTYLQNTHLTIERLICEMFNEYTMKQILFEGMLYDIDSYEYSRIPGEETEQLVNHCEKEYILFDETVEKINKILYNINDICTFEIPNSETVFIELENLIARENEYQERFVELDDRFSNTDFEALEKHIDDAITYIRSIKENQIDISVYKEQDIQALPVYQMCLNNEKDIIEYVNKNNDLLESAMDIYTKVNKKVKADERMDMGCSKIWKGTTKIFKGIMCIYLTLTCGPEAGSVLYTTGIGSSTIKSVFGGMDIIEGGQDIYYGWNGDIDTETINYLKDVLGEKAYNNIEKYATITMDFTMFADFVLAVDSWVNGFGMLSGETEMAGEMAALESLENVELAEIESVELANAETVTIETVEGEVVEIEAAAECGSSIGEAGLVENEIKGGSNSIRDLMLQSESSKKWGILDDGTNQGVKHFADYWERYPERIPSLEQRLGVNVGDFSNSLEGFENFTKQAERVIDDAVANGNVRNINGKSIYYMDGIANPKKGVVVIVKDGKIQSMMPSDFKSFNKLQ